MKVLIVRRICSTFLFNKEPGSKFSPKVHNLDIACPHGNAKAPNRSINLTA